MVSLPPKCPGLGLLDLPPEVLLKTIAAVESPVDLARLVMASKALYQIALPRLWEHLALDLTISTNETESHLFDAKRSTALLATLASGAVSPYALQHVKRLDLNLDEHTQGPLLEFLAARLVRPDLLKNLRSLAVTGPAWTNIETVKARLLMPFQRRNVQVALHDISLSCLVELAVPPAPLNDQITHLSLMFSSISNRASDLVLTTKTLALLPHLSAFNLTFNEDFDLCDDPQLPALIAGLIAGLPKTTAKLGIFDFPPYMAFPPACLPPHVTEFVFHANQIDSEAAFFTGVFQSAQLTSLSVRIAHSIDSAPVPIPARENPLPRLLDLTLDTPSTPTLLPLFTSHSRTLARLHVAHMSTSLLVAALLPLQHTLTHLYIYSFAKGASPACPALTLATAARCFERLRVLALPKTADAATLLPVAATTATTPGKHLSIILSLSPSSSHFAYPPLPSTSCSCSTPSSYSLLPVTRASLWSLRLFSRVDELDLFHFYNEGLVLAVL